MNKSLAIVLIWLCVTGCGLRDPSPIRPLPRPEAPKSRDDIFYAPTRLRISHLRDSLDVVESVATSHQRVSTRVRTGMAYGWKTQLYYRDELRLVPIFGAGGVGNPKTNLPHEGGIGGLVMPRELYAVRQRVGVVQLVAEFTLFETEIPCQHLWQPQRGSQYRELWQGLAVGEWRLE